MPKKKHVPQKAFERKIEVWKTVIPLIVALISSLTLVSIALLNKPKTEYKMSPDDQLEVNRLSALINLLSEKYFEAKDQNEEERLDAELRVLAETEATIMRKYNPNYRSRWPLARWQSRIGLSAILISLALVAVGISAYYALKRMRERRRRELLTGCIIKVMRRDSLGAGTSEIIRRIRDDHPHYRPEDIEDAILWLADVEHKIEGHSGRWALIAEDVF